MDGESLPPRVKDLKGKQYGMLTVLSFDRVENRNAFWLCSCECGNVIVKPARNLAYINSCGCMSVKTRMTTERSSTHSMSKTRVYGIWQGMKMRATKWNYERAEDYSKRGIGVSESWLSFENFYADMGDPPSEYHSLERINNNLGYSKGNCKWETAARQQSNRRVSNNTSGRIGVNFCSFTGRWRATLRCDKVNIWVGRFDSFEDACEAIEKAELENLGYSRKEGFIKEEGNGVY